MGWWNCKIQVIFCGDIEGIVYSRDIEEWVTALIREVWCMNFNKTWKGNYLLTLYDNFKASLLQF